MIQDQFKFYNLWPVSNQIQEQQQEKEKQVNWEAESIDSPIEDDGEFLADTAEDEDGDKLGDEDDDDTAEDDDTSIVGITETKEMICQMTVLMEEMEMMAVMTQKFRLMMEEMAAMEETMAAENNIICGRTTVSSCIIYGSI